MIHSKIYCVLLLLLITSVSIAQEKFKISGKLTNIGLYDKVILSYKDAEGKDKKDSTIVKKGKFNIEGTTRYGNKAYISLVSSTNDENLRGSYKEFYLEKGNYTIKGDSSMSKANIDGSQAQKDFLVYSEEIGAPHAVYKDLAQKYMTARSAKDEKEMERLVEEIKPVIARIEAALDSFIFNHPDSWVALNAVNDNRTMVIDPVTFDPYYKALSSRVLDSHTGRILTEKYEKAKQLAIGRTMDFTLPDGNDKDFQLSSLKGKYVLVDFWASWCAPCRAENPHLLKAYNQLKDKGFEIVGISLDENKEAWLNAVKVDGMPWTQVGDLKGFKSEIAVQYGISAIPQNVLIDRNGVIIAKNLRGENVNEQIAELIK